MKLLRTIRFDPSDVSVFDHAAPEGDWAVSGGFAFSAVEPGALTGKARQAFSNGFLGLPSLGRSTFVTVAQATAEDREAIIDALARHFVADWGAPSTEAARPAAEDEVTFASELCADAAIGTVLTVMRDHDPDGQIREAFRAIARPGNCGEQRVWDIVEEAAP